MQLISTVLLAVAAIAAASPVPANVEHDALRREPVVKPASDGAMGSWGGLADWKRWLSQGEPTWIEIPKNENEARSDAEENASEAHGEGKGPHQEWEPWGSPTWKREDEQTNAPFNKREDEQTNAPFNKREEEQTDAPFNKRGTQQGNPVW